MPRVEILDDDGAQATREWPPLEPRTAAVDRANGTPVLDLGQARASERTAPADDAEPPKAAPETVEHPVGWRGMFGVISSAESFALAGVLIAVSSYLSVAPLFLSTDGDQWEPAEMMRRFAAGFGLGGLLAMAFGALGIWRSAQGTSALVKGCAGAAVLLGAVLVLLAAYLTVTSSGLSEPTSTFD